MMEKLGGFLAEINAAYVYIFIAIIAVYLIIRPVTRWAVTTKTTKFLNYMVSSLVMLVLILSGIVLTTVFDKVLLSAVMHCLAFSV